MECQGHGTQGVGVSRRIENEGRVPSGVWQLRTETGKILSSLSH